MVANRSTKIILNAGKIRSSETCVCQCHRFHPQGRDMEQKVEKSGSENVSLLSAVDAKDAHCLN